LVNLAAEANIPAAQNLTDFCIRPSGTTDWGRPVFRDGGDSYSPGTPGAPGGPDPLCSKGLPYGQSTIPFNVPAGKIDVKAIPAGKTCTNSAGTSQITDVTVGDFVNGGAPVVTIVRWGGDQTPENLADLSEEPKGAISNTSQSYFRVVNALSSRQSIQFGTPTAMTLPTTVGTPFIYTSPIKPGGVEPPGTTALSTMIDARGYNQYLPQEFWFAASVASDPANKAIAIFHSPKSDAGDVATLYVIGDPSSNYYPLRGLYCEDSPKFTLPSDAGSGALSGYLPQDYSLLAKCTPTALPLLSVDTFNVSLYGANAPYETDRRPTILNEIAARTSDLMCLLELDNLSDRQAVAGAVQAGHFPYSYMVTTTETTSPTNPSDVRPTPSAPPCGGVDLSNIASCVEQKCSTAPDAGTGELNGSTNCLSANCTPSFGPVYVKNHYCFDCIIYYLTSLQQISSMQTNCTQDDNPPFAFAGQTPSMILSHYPLKNTQFYVLPASGFRRAVLKAQVELEDNQIVDFFCGQLSSPLIDADLPYTGYYGKDMLVFDGGAPENGWEDEQDLQATEAIQWMEQQADADGLPAIIAGDWHSSVPCTAGSGCSTTLNALSPEVNATFTSTKSSKTGKTAVLAHPPNYVRTCDYCAAPTNSYNTGTYSYEWTPTYIYGFPNPTGSAVAETLWDTDNIVPIPEMNGMLAPIAEAYPRNVQLLRPR
jgi:hypothetical protein